MPEILSFSSVEQSIPETEPFLFVISRLTSFPARSLSLSPFTVSVSVRTISAFIGVVSSSGRFLSISFILSMTSEKPSSFLTTAEIDDSLFLSEEPTSEVFFSDEVMSAFSLWVNSFFFVSVLPSFSAESYPVGFFGGAT